MDTDDPMCKSILEYLGRLNPNRAVDRQIRFHLREHKGKRMRNAVSEAIGWRLNWLVEKGYLTIVRTVNRESLYALTDEGRIVLGKPLFSEYVKTGEIVNKSEDVVH